MNTFTERRRSSGGWIWPVVRGLGLAFCGLFYLLWLFAGVILLASYMGAL